MMEEAASNKEEINLKATVTRVSKILNDIQKHYFALYNKNCWKMFWTTLL